MTSPQGIKAVILAGGKGTRLSEETIVRPKPMVEVGGRPLLWHIMKNYSHHGIRDFIICLGFKGHMIKEYFFHYSLFNADVTIETRGGMTVHHSQAEDWRVTLVETGEETMTGGRLRRIRNYLGDDSVFCLTYGDGVGDVDITETIAFHQRHGKLATVTAVRPMARFGALDMREDGYVRQFDEKPPEEGGFINGGFFVLSPKVIDYIEGDAILWEKQPLQALAREGQLKAYVHKGFWQPVDTLRDRTRLEELWAGGHPPWKLWR